MKTELERCARLHPPNPKAINWSQQITCRTTKMENRSGFTETYIRLHVLNATSLESALAMWSHGHCFFVNLAKYILIAICKAVFFHSDNPPSHLPSNHGFDVVMYIFRTQLQGNWVRDTFTWGLWNIFTFSITPMNSFLYCWLFRCSNGSQQSSYCPVYKLIWHHYKKSRATHHIVIWVFPCYYWHWKHVSSEGRKFVMYRFRNLIKL